MVEIPPRSQGLPEPPLLARIRDGGDRRRPGHARPLRPAPRHLRRLHRQSGRALDFIEDFIRDEVLPRYANTHTESSGTGLQTTRLREDARRDHPRRASTATTTTVVDLRRVGLHRRDQQADRHPRPAHPGRPRRPLRPERAHPARRAARGVHRPVRAPQQRAALARVDRRRGDHPRGRRRPHRHGRLRAAARVEYADRPLQDRLLQRRHQRDRHRHATPSAISTLLHEHGALAFWDFAAAAPYVDIEMTPRGGDPLAYKDAILLSPHKFIGGPGTPGRARGAPRAVHQPGARSCPAAARWPTSTPTEHRYLADPEHREEGGTPAIVEAIRAGPGLPAQARPSGAETIRAHEEDFVRRAVAAWATNPAIEMLGNLERRAAVDRLVRGARARTATTCTTTSWSRCSTTSSAIQARGGCSCAGPYGHRLLGIDLERSHEFESRDHRAAARASSRAGCGSTSTTSSPRRSFRLRRGGRATWSPSHGWRAARATTASTRQRSVAAPRRAGRAAPAPRRPALRTTSGELVHPATTTAPARRCSPSTCARAARSWRPQSPVSTARRRSSTRRWPTCSGSSSPLASLPTASLPAASLP